MSENWEQIDGFANYEVSDHGRTRNKTTNKILQPFNSGGRMSVTLYINGRGYGKRVHNLVANRLYQTPANKNTCIMQISMSGTAGQIICIGFHHWTAISCLPNTCTGRQCCKS